MVHKCGRDFVAHADLSKLGFFDRSFVLDININRNKSFCLVFDGKFYT